jgi:hypothetical protein
MRAFFTKTATKTMKEFMFNLKLLLNHPYVVSFLALLSTLLKFVLESWSVNIILFGLLFVSIAFDTWTGVRLSKNLGTYDYKILKEKTVKKTLGYITFLMALWVFTMMLFLMNLKDGQPIVSTYYLNIPMMTTFLFFAGIEFLSTKDNIVKNYGIITPNSVVDNIEKFVGAGGKDYEKLINKN